MAGPGPAIHVLTDRAKTWMAATGAAMTRCDSGQYYLEYSTGAQPDSRESGPGDDAEAESSSGIADAFPHESVSSNVPSAWIA